MTTTVIYYTSNREDPKFEKKIQEDLISKSGTLPIISVSQKPISLGENICVGEVGASGFNMCRQIQIALKAINSDFVVSAEADCLYSPDYFYFTPPRLDVCYRNTNIYILKYKRDCFNRKTMSTFSQVVGRKFYLERLNELFEGAPMWSTEEKNFPKERKKGLFDKYEFFQTEFPCVSFKTGRGMRQHTNTEEEEFGELPYWGKVEDFKKKYYENY